MTTSKDDKASTSASAEDSTAAEGQTATEEAAPVTLGEGNGQVVLTGAIAAKYTSLDEASKNALGAPLTGEDESGTSESGVHFQQFDGGVISTSVDGATAYVTWGEIRNAWNVKRDEAGQPSEDGKGGSSGPLGAATSDEVDAEGGLKQSTFEHGTITFSPDTQEVVVTVNGEVVPSGL